jgi:metallo-beta-lactamase family protein
MQLEFFGAAGEVTGSCHILRVAGRQLLLDCGMIQGDHDAPARNRLPFPFDPTTVDAVVLSHAHIDHCGRLPLLVKRGFRGPIYTNKACADLVPILLRDSANLAMRDAERERVTALYDLEDVETTLRLLQPIAYDTRRELLPGVTVQVRDAGHILGSSSIEVWVSEGGEQRKLVFSGDLGQYDTPILKDPFAFESADLVLMESTYGNRQHRGREDTERELGGILAQAQRDGGNVIVPAFAIGRSQELLYLLAKHYGEWHLARWKIFLDSPMAIAASRVYWNNPDRFDEETTRLRASFRGMPPLPNLVLSESADDSRAINHRAQWRAHHCRIWHGDRGPCAASPQTQSRTTGVPRGHRWLPGAWNSGSTARRPCARCAHSWSARALPRADPHAGRPFRAWRSGGPVALV